MKTIKTIQMKLYLLNKYRYLNNKIYYRGNSQYTCILIQYWIQLVYLS